MFGNDFWLFIESNEKRRKEGEIFGKWLLFLMKEEALEQWKKIAIAIGDGSLAVSSAKISRQTKNYLINGKYCETHVVCIYTYQDNVDLVRKQLFDLGFTNSLCYKEEKATEQASYGHASHLICENKSHI